ncbi:hypothetical protein GGI25_002359 [Coemansia spiralis]|uniref:Lysophospholipase n=1 Tax=Coemansia spiralis TaxID=417178 RepID=A0A9W8GAP3_9FUNG|nr:hypothetical protein GGI25_002359 [Coemansia spiralis]
MYIVLSCAVAFFNSPNQFASTSKDRKQKNSSAEVSDDPSEDSWYSGILSILGSISNSLPPQPLNSQKQTPKDDKSTIDADTSYISWLGSAKVKLDALADKIRTANWNKPTSQTNIDNGSSLSEPSASSVDSKDLPKEDSAQEHILLQISALQTQISQRIDETKAALGDVVYNMLPEQLQRPWVTACAQMCIDPEVHPELLQSATVRMGHGICGQEADFQKQRARHIRNDFAEFIGVAAATVDERDIPIIGVAGSGGGFRAMIATVGSYRAMQLAGLAQCVTYDAAVSGSSWAIAALHTYANGSPFKVLENLREAMQNSMFSTANLVDFVKSNDLIAKRVFVDMATKYLLSSTEDKQDTEEVIRCDVQDRFSTPTSTAAVTTSSSFTHKIVDEMVQQGERLIESVLPGNYTRKDQANSEITVPATIDELIESVESSLEKLSVPKLSIVDLYGALLFKQLIVQHKPGFEDSSKAELDLDPKWTRLSAQRTAVDRGHLPMPIYTAVRHFIGSHDNDTQATESHRYQWFEFNPYEFGSIDHGAWIPSWAFGRPMVDGCDQIRIGETHFGSIMGTVASAFCASVKAMVMEVYMNIPTPLRPAVDPLLDWFDHDTEISHLVPPYTLYNPFFRKDPTVPEKDGSLAELESERLLSLMDAGLENNLPFAPLLRKERQVDVIICLDSSANIDIMPWFARAEAWASIHGIERWPWGARPWAADPLRPSKAEVELSRSMLSSTKQASKNVESRFKDGNVRCVVFNKALAPSPLRSHSSSSSSSLAASAPMPSSPSSPSAAQPPLTLLYLPLLGNKEFRDSSFDPGTADFCATFNDKWTVEQVNKLADLASLNFAQEVERIRLAVKQAYERKRAYRLYMESLNGK